MLTQIRNVDTDTQIVRFILAPFFAKDILQAEISKDDFITWIGFKPKTIDDINGLVLELSEIEFKPSSVLRDISQLGDIERQYGVYDTKVIITDVNEPESICGRITPSLRYSLPDFHGDFAWRSKQNVLWIVERKEANDLLASITDGRFQRTISTILQVATVPSLLVEGILSANADMTVRTATRPVTGFNYNGVEHLIGEAQLAGVLKMESPVEWMTATILRSWQEWSDQPEHFSLVKPKTPALGTDGHRGAAALSLLVGQRLGYGKALKVIKHYGGNWAGMIGATEKDFAKIDGIGIKLANAIYDALHGGKPSLEN